MNVASHKMPIPRDELVCGGFRRRFRRYDISIHEERKLAYQRLKMICQSGLVSILDFRRAPCTMTRVLQHSSSADARTSCCVGGAHKAFIFWFIEETTEFLPRW